MTVPGSSPLARGLPDGQPESTDPRLDHPRSRGVYDGRARGGVREEGSSPLARGLRQDESRAAFDRGIIPARAGFTTPRRAPGSSRWDHPRSRGVYTYIPATKPTGGGSSPLARGLPTP